MSLVETIANVVVGFQLALIGQITAFPLFGLQVSVVENLMIGGIFTSISIVRSFALRRLFEAIRVCKQSERFPRRREGPVGLGQGGSSEPFILGLSRPRNEPVAK